jgi:transposase-like protein
VELLATGKPVPELAGELCVSGNLLYNGRVGAQSLRLASAELRAAGARSEADELRALRCDWARLQLENDILKKAAVILVTRGPASSIK